MEQNTLHLKPINEFKFPECTDEDLLPEYLVADIDGYLHVIYLSFYNGKWSIYDTDTGDRDYNLDELVGCIPVNELNVVID